MQIQMKVTMSDGSIKDCTAIFADFVMFERTWNRSVTKFSDELRLTDIAWLAWRTEIRLKHITIQFDEWLEGVVEIEMIADEPVGDSVVMPESVAPTVPLV
jgi:hypothetical protein